MSAQEFSPQWVRKNKNGNLRPSLRTAAGFSILDKKKTVFITLNRRNWKNIYDFSIIRTFCSIIRRINKYNLYKEKTVAAGVALPVCLINILLIALFYHLQNHTVLAQLANSGVHPIAL